MHQRHSQRDGQEDLPGLFVHGGAEGVRTPDLIRARDALSQLSHGPIGCIICDSSRESKTAVFVRSADRFQVDTASVGSTIEW